MIVRMDEGRFAFGCTVAAFGVALAAFVYLWLAPVYSDGATLAETNGQWVLLLVAAPAIIAGITWIGLHAACSRGSRVGRAVAWLAVSVLAITTVLGMFSIGMFLAPVTALLIAGAAATPEA
jgi:hypothetical protein